MVFPLSLLKPWPQRGVAFVLGCLGALAFAPLFLLPALLISLGVIWLILERNLKNNASYGKLFWLGWFYGLGFFTAGLYWISAALFVDIATFWWLLPFALFGIPTILAAYMGISFTLLKLWPYEGASRLFAFASLWVGMEWIRGHALTGFPWNLMGYSWAFSLEMTQLASTVGVYGLSLLTILLACSWPLLLRKDLFSKAIAMSILIFIGCCWVWGKSRLHNAENLSHTSIAIRLVQPNIPQTLKWDSSRAEAHFKDLLKLTTEPSSLPLKAIIWPETALPFFLEHNLSLRIHLGQSLPKDALLFTGTLRRTLPGKVHPQLWNSLEVLNDRGEIVATYDKSHLVPFGEYLPFRSTLDSIFGKGTLKKLTAGAVDFTPGEGPQTVSLPEDLPSFSGLVCYEVIFPRAVINAAQPRPSWIVNVTNDGWYGDTSGPYQHLQMTRFRSVEEGIPLVRVANTGVSAVFDGYGRKIGSIDLNKQGVLDVWLPSPTPSIPLYARWGDWITLFIILGSLGIGALLAIPIRKLALSSL